MHGRNITQANCGVRCPRWSLGFQEFALPALAKHFMKFPSYPADEAGKETWDFVVKQLHL